MSLFSLRGNLPTMTRTILEISGFALVLLIWFILTMGADPIVSTSLLPSPASVISSFPELISENSLVKNTCHSLGLNLAGYVEALAIAIPLGFLIGLFPFFRGGFQRQVDAIRYVPLTAVTGLFIIWFGLGTSMKVHFLAFGILIYLLPIVVQRIDEVKDVYLKTVYTLGATDWQTIKSVYFPSVISRLSDDVRVLTAISWTYIIVAESLGSQGGIGQLIWSAGQRQGRVDKIFALLIIIIIIGIIQDKVFIKLDKIAFPFKYQTHPKHQNTKVENQSIYQSVWDFAITLLGYAALAIYLVLLANEWFGFIGDNEQSKVLSYLFGDTVWVVHLIMILTITYVGYQFYKRKTSPVTP